MKIIRSRKKKKLEERLRLERERKRRLEEEKSIREEEEIHKRTVEPLQFKDIPLKTFYTVYIQKNINKPKFPSPKEVHILFI